MADFVKISDSLESPSSKTAASTVALSSIAESILDAAKNVAEGSDNSTDLREPLLADVYHEIGTWWISLDNSIPVGGLPHLGHLCTRDTYGDFWTWCETNKTVVSDEEWLAYAESHNGCCPYYSSGDGSTTFRTPKYDQSFLKVLASIGDAGKIEEAGLPNITGAFDSAQYYPYANVSGAFFVSQQKNRTYDAGGPNATQYAFDASLSNPIYGNSDTVTPQNFGVIVGVYAVSAVSAPIGETDAANLLNGLSTLENRTGALESSTGFSEMGRQAIVGWGMPDYSAGVAISSGYVADMPGVVFIGARDATSGDIYVNGNKIGREQANNQDASTVTVPLASGDTITWSGNLSAIVFPCRMV